MTALTPLRIAGIVLIVLGIAALAYGGFDYRKRDEVARIGDLKMEVTDKKHVAIPPLVSGIAVLAGAAMLFGGGRRQG